jgi:phosphoribosylformimino-5-aminoimidazole carboxamide ribotide isomerase
MRVSYDLRAPMPHPPHPFRIIPAIDIIGGQCVRLTQGDYAQQKTYNADPLAVARMFEDSGLRHLHLVDLDGAKAGHVVNTKVLETIAQHTSLTIDFGGGLRTAEDIATALNAGAAQVNIGSAAVKQRELFLGWLKEFGTERIILSADVRGESVAVSGWQEGTAVNVFDLIEDYRQHGLRYVVCTDISKDGLLQGSSIALYGKLMARFPDLRLIASGGVTEMSELQSLRGLGVDGAIIGKALYEQRISLAELTSFAE